MLLGRWAPIEPSSRPRPELFAELPLAGVLPRLRFRPRPMDPTHHPSPLEDAPRSLGDSGVSPAASVPNAATHRGFTRISWCRGACSSFPSRIEVGGCV